MQRILGLQARVSACRSARPRAAWRLFSVTTFAHKSSFASAPVYLPRDHKPTAYATARDYNTEPAPQGFRAGVLGKVQSIADIGYENEAGFPSTGREDCLVGVKAAKRLKAGDKSVIPSRHIFNEFSLDKRVGFVTGGNGGIGLEMAVALCEAGADIYLVDLAAAPSADVVAAQEYVEALGQRLIYLQGDVTNQRQMWELGDKIGDAEGRLDICVAAAGITAAFPALEYPYKEFDKIMQVNVNGCFITAQTAARQMRRFNQSGSIVLIASMSGSITNRDDTWIAYNSSKSAVVQMARSLACELGKYGIRASTISPGHVRTNLTEKFFEANPAQEEKWADLNPLGRIGRVHEMRGVVCWLASDASSFVTGSDVYVNAGQHAW